jgi:cysteine desulfurase
LDRVAPKPLHFLDHNAGTKVDPRVLECFLEVEARCPGNPSSLHEAGRRARNEIERAREQIAQILGFTAEDVLFTSGGTESNNLAVRGIGDPKLPVLLAPVEHASVWEPAQLRGTVAWSVSKEGRAILTKPATPVGLACLVHGQSEVGTLQDVGAAARLCSSMSVPLHVDAAQSLGRIPLAEVSAGATSMAFAPHKAGGLRGTGILCVRDAAERLQPLLRGGGQERGLRPGTVSPAAAAAAALTVQLATAEQSIRAERMALARTQFTSILVDANSLCRVLTPTTSLPNTLLVHVPEVDGRNLLPALDLAGIAISQGSACSSGSPLPPRVLIAMGLDEVQARSCVRISFGWSEPAAGVVEAAELFARVIARLQKKI